MEKMLCTVRVLGKLKQGGETETVETLSDGFLRRDEKTLEIVYKEPVEESDESTRVKVIFSKPELQGKSTECRIIRKGPVESEMLFLPGYETVCVYKSPFGEIGFEINTRDVKLSEAEGEIRAELDYSLSSNQIPLSEADVSIVAKYCPAD